MRSAPKQNLSVNLNWKEKLMRNALALGLVLVSSTALAGRGATTVSIENAIASNSVDAIVAELERAEFLACLSCIDPVMKLVDHDSPKVREAAGWWLGRRGARAVVITDMTARLGESDPIAARNAGDVLAGMRDPATLPALANYLSHPLDEASGMSVARAIGEIGDPAGLKALSVGMSSSLAGVRAQSLRALRNLRAPVGQTTVSTASATLMPLFSDADASVRVQAAYTAGHWKDRGAVTPLAQLVAAGPNQDQDAKVRKAAAWALGEIGDGAAQAALTGATKDADAGVRSIATAALGRLH
jgi:HEAT repeat protein